MITIETDVRSGKVNLKYGLETLNAKQIALEPARVVSAHAAVLKSLTGRKTDLDELLRLFFESYRRVLFAEGCQVGDRANIIDCYRELVWLKQSGSFKRRPSRDSFSDYPRDYFAFDVLQLRRNNVLTHKNHRLQFGTATIDATGNDLRSIWIPEGAGEGRYIMDIYWTSI